MFYASVHLNNNNNKIKQKTRGLLDSALAHYELGSSIFIPATKGGNRHNEDGQLLGALSEKCVTGHSNTWKS